MILKRYGNMLHSVTPHFDARAMNEIGFQRSHELSLEHGEFTERYELKEVHELSAEADGLVQLDAETGVLRELRRRLDTVHDACQDGHVLVVESESGRDYPKLHEKTTTIVIEGENKLHFHRTVGPPLRMGVYAPRAS